MQLLWTLNEFDKENVFDICDGDGREQENSIRKHINKRHVSALIIAIKNKCGSKKIVVYPNSGEAYNAKSKTWMGTSDPELFTRMAEEWIALGADIIGGCCRIGPDHIGAIRQKVIHKGNC